MPFHQIVTEKILPHLKEYFKRSDTEKKVDNVKAELIIQLGHNQSLKGKDASGHDTKETNLDLRQLSNNKTVLETLSENDKVFKEELATLIKHHTDWIRLSKLFIMLRLEHRIKQNLDLTGRFLDLEHEFINCRTESTRACLKKLASLCEIPEGYFETEKPVVVNLFETLGKDYSQLVACTLHVIKSNLINMINQSGQFQATDLEGAIDACFAHINDKTKSKVKINTLANAKDEEFENICSSIVQSVSDDYKEDITYKLKLVRKAVLLNRVLTAVDFSIELENVCVDAWLEKVLLDDLVNSKSLVPQKDGNAIAYQGLFCEIVEIAIGTIKEYRAYCQMHDAELPAGKSKANTDLESLRHFHHKVPGGYHALQDFKIQETLVKPWDIIIQNFMSYFADNVIKDQSFHVFTNSAWNQTLRNAQSFFRFYDTGLAREKRELIKDFIRNLHKSYPRIEPDEDEFNDDPWQPFNMTLGFFKNELAKKESVFNMLLPKWGYIGWCPEIHQAYINILEQLNQKWKSFHEVYGRKLIENEPASKPRA